MTMQLLQRRKIPGLSGGVAYDRERKKLYTASLLRRHADLGTDGLGAIYVSDMSSGANTELFIDVSKNIP